MEDVIRGLAKLVKRLGFSEGYGVIYAHLLLSGKPLTVKELSEKTGYSQSAVAAYLMVLHRAYLVDRMKQGASYAYVAKLDYIGRYKEKLRELLERDLVPLLQAIEKTVNSVEDEEQKGHLEKVLAEIKKIEYFVRKVLEIEV